MHLTLIGAFAALFLLSTFALADEPLPEASPPGAKDVVLDVSEGLTLRTRDGKASLKLGGYFDTDLRTTGFAGTPLVPSFSLQRARLFLDAKIAPYLRAGFEANFAISGVSRIKHAYIDVGPSPALQVRAGFFKVPFGFEELISGRYTPLVDRSIATENVTPGRDIGLMVHGKLAGETFGYQLAVTNGTGEDAVGDTNGDKDVLARLIYEPIPALHFGVAGTFGKEADELGGDGLETSAGTPFLVYAAGVQHEGWRQRYGAEATALIGPASLRAELFDLRLADLKKMDVVADLNVIAWYVTATWIITGEDASLRQIAPRRGWGAFELAARLSQVAADSAARAAGLAAGATRATELTLGLSWYVNRLVTVRANYIRATFESAVLVGAATPSPETRNDEDSFAFRFQGEF